MDSIYACSYAGQGMLARIRKTDMQLTSTLSVGFGVVAMTADDMYLYLGKYTSPGKILRVLKADMSIVQTLSMPQPKVAAFVIVQGIMFAGTASGVVAVDGYRYPSDCIQTPWTSWGSCTVAHVAGGRYVHTCCTHKRSRRILKLNKFGGLPCGQTVDEEQCHSPPCPVKLIGLEAIEKTRDGTWLDDHKSKQFTWMSTTPRKVKCNGGHVNLMPVPVIRCSDMAAGVIHEINRDRCRCPNDKPVLHLGTCISPDNCPTLKIVHATAYVHVQKGLRQKDLKICRFTRSIL